MFPFPNNDNFLNDNGLEDGSSERPPQYNDTNCGCGYRCGWGCEEPTLEEDDGGFSDSDTIVVSQEDLESDVQPEGEDPEADLQQQDVAVANDIIGSHRDIIFLINDGEEYPAYAFYRDTDDLSDGLNVNPCSTRSSSIAPSSSGSNRSQSPLPGFDVITAGMPTLQLAGIYYFLESPLRLVPQ